MQAQNLLKNQSKQDTKVKVESSPQDIQHHQPQLTDHEILPIPNPSPLEYQSKRGNKLKQLWAESEDMILVVASLIATVTYQAGLSPPPTIWQQGMKLNFDCMFRQKQKISLSDPAAADTCPAFTFYFFMSFNTAGFFSSIFLIFLFRNKAFVAVLLPTSLSCMAVTYIALSLSMSPNAVTFLVIYFFTIMILVYFLFAVNALQSMIHGVSCAGGKAVRKIGSRIIRSRRQSSDLVDLSLNSVIRNKT